MKTLISWEAFNNDYDEQGNPSSSGPNIGFHQAFYKRNEFDKHILLSARTRDKDKAEQLAGYINHLYEDHKVELRFLSLKDIIDVNEIKGVISTLLKNYSDDELYFFVSPGTPAMQVAWYLMHIELHQIKTNLVQTRRARDTKQKQSDLIFIDYEKSAIPTSLIQNELNQLKEVEGISDEVFLGNSLKPIYSNALKVAQAESIHVLIQGPTGSGKEHLAKYIHDQSARRSKELLTINCSAFTDELLLSELFGHEKGAFTGAHNKKEGLFQKANGGSLFLDEIGDISPFTQQALLRVLQNGEVRPVGSSDVHKVDVRVIVATHKNLKKLCSQELFRWDLFYRLSTATLKLPSLRDRGVVEVEQYLNFIINQLRTELKKSKKLSLSKKVRDFLISYPYPGNLREMKNIISTLYVFYDEQLVDDFAYMPELLEEELAIDSLKYEDVEFPFMKQHLDKVLKHTHGNISKAARELGWSQNQLRKKMNAVNLEVNEYRI